MIANLENEEVGLERDAEMEDVENEEDNNGSYFHTQVHHRVDLTEVMTDMRNLKIFMTQRFDAQDLQF